MRAKSKIGYCVGGLSLLFAALAYIPSAAAFTPAILLTLVAFVGSVIAAGFGSYRLAAVTLFLVGATFLTASHTFSGIIRVEYLMILLAGVAVILSAILYGQYKRATSDT